MSSATFFSNWTSLKFCRGVRGREVERRPCNLEVPSSIPGSGCQLWDFFIGPHIRREYWCSSQEAESREISISCKNLFLNRCKINMFKVKILSSGNGLSKIYLIGFFCFVSFHVTRSTYSVFIFQSRCFIFQ